MKQLAIILLLFAVTLAARAATDQSRGLDAAGAITKITGVAISPLLGVGVVGAYDWWRTPKEKKADLNWYAKPWFWLSALLLVGGVAAKDALGTVLPPGVKKPLDVAETVENKVSGLVATGAFVPLAASIFKAAGLQSLHFGGAGFAAIDFMPILNVFTIPFAVAAFVLVWLVGHVITVLILVSPFGPVDAALKSLRTVLLGLLTTIHFINPWIGALLSLIIIIIAYFIAGWSFRMMLFGSVFTWDFITGRRKRFTPAPNANWMFTARKIEKTPIRTYGKLVKNEDGRLSFEYRPWLFMQKRTQVIPPGKYAVGRGLFYPEILQVEGEKAKPLLTLSPRYKKHEEELAQIYAISDIRDTGLLKGIKALWRWFTRNLFGSDSREAAVATAAV